MKKLRDFQLTTVNTVMEKVAAKCESGIGVMATGLGKTFTAANIINKFPGRTLWITHTEELIEQSAMAILNEETDGVYNDYVLDGGGIIATLNRAEHTNLFSGAKPNGLSKIKEIIGIIKQERCDINSKINVASIQTLWRRLERIPKNHFDLIIADECHLAASVTWKKALTHFTPKLRLGLTATPTRLDGLSLNELFEERFCDYDIKFGIDEGYLVEIDAVKIQTHTNLDSVRTTAGELNQGDLEKMVNTPARNRLIVNKYKEYFGNKQVIVSCVDVQHVRDLHQMFVEEGILASFVVGDPQICPDRKERISLFKTGEIRVLLHVNVLTMGFDHDMVEGVIQARPTKSVTVYLQQIGRGTRPVSGIINGLNTAEERRAAIKASAKPKLIILDIVDNTSKHSLINCWELDKKKPLDEKTFITSETREKLREEAEKRKTKITHEVKKDHKVDLFKLPEVKIWNTGKNLEDATEKQLAWLEKLGYDTKQNYYSKFDASTIISDLPANYYQIQELQRLNYDTTKGVTRGEYSAAIAEIEKKRQGVESRLTFASKIPFTNIE